MIELIGTAKLMPADWPTWLMIAVFMPITWPREFSSGPPELPGLIAASVWMIPLIIRPFLALSERSRLLTIPEVSVRSSPNGLPRARIFWPTSTLDESPKVTGKSLSAGTWIRSTATSLEASAPTILAGWAEPSKSVTRTAIGPLDDVKIGQDVALLVDDEPRARPGRGLVAEEAPALGLGRDVDDALVHRGIDQDVVPLVGVELLEHVFGRGRGPCPGGLDRDRSPVRDAGTWTGRAGGGSGRESGNLNHGRLPPQTQAIAEEQHHERQRHHDRDRVCRDRPSHRRPFLIHQRETPSRSRAWPAKGSDLQSLSCSVVSDVSSWILCSWKRATNPFSPPHNPGSSAVAGSGAVSDPDQALGP